MNEKDIREYSRTLLDAFNDLTGNSINPNLDDFLKIRERSIFELNSFCKNNQQQNKISENVENININDNKIVNVPSNQKTNVDETEIDDLKEKKELVLTSTSESASTSKATSKVEKQENIKTENKQTLIQNKNKNVDNKQQEISNNNVIADETDDFVFGNDEDNFNMSERKTAFDVLKGIEDPWN